MIREDFLSLRVRANTEKSLPQVVNHFGAREDGSLRVRLFDKGIIIIFETQAVVRKFTLDD